MIVTQEGEIIPARAYASRESYWINKYGYWQLKMNPGWDFWVICEYVAV